MIFAFRYLFGNQLMDILLVTVLVYATISTLLGVNGHCTDTCGCYPRDCEDIRDLGFTASGVYRISPGGTPRGYEVYCDMETEEGGWTVFQRRQNGLENFYLGWDDYQLGFGNPAGEHWLGNVPLHIFTVRNDYQLRIDLEDWEGNTSYAKYQLFRIGSSLDLYKLEVAGYSGIAGDSLTVFSGHTFKTHDDKDVGNHCAERMDGAWWYVSCSTNDVSGSTLNGQYYHNGSHILDSYEGGRGVTWKEWHGMHYSLKKTEMKIRRI